MKEIYNLGKRDAYCARQRTRQNAQQLNNDPGRDVLKSLQHSLGRATVSLQKMHCPAGSCGVYLFAASFAHLARVARNGYADWGGSMFPCSEVLKGTMRP